MKLFPIETELFIYQHLLDSDENLRKIDEFSIVRLSGQGLEQYLKEVAVADENDGSARTYLIKDKATNEIAAYFTLKAGLFTIKASEDYFYTVPSVELANLAVNSNYKNMHPDIKAIGSTVFSEFILPIVDFLRTFLGIQAIYIFALPEQSLIEHYETMGFNRLEPDEEQFVHVHVKPKYDDGCIFMYQIL